MSNKVYVIGVGMTKFEKPGRREGWDYPAMANESGTKALTDAGIAFDAVEQAYVGFCYGESCSGHRAVYELGLTGIPVFNVNSNCSTGSSALFLAAQAIRGGLADCTLALGFEKMQTGSLGTAYDDREQPLQQHLLAMAELRDLYFPPAPWMFGAAGMEHNEKYGSTVEHFVNIAAKNHRHSVNNPYAQFQEEYSLDDILAAKMISDPLTKLQCSPTSDGSGAAILASEEFVDSHGLDRRARPVGGRRALQLGQRVGDHPGGQDVVEGVGVLELRERVVDRVLVVLVADLREVFGGGAVLLHVFAASRAEHPRRHGKRELVDLGHRLDVLAHRRLAVLRATTERAGLHLLEAERDSAVDDAAADGLRRQEKRGRAR